MEITEEFLRAEIAALQAEAEKANVFLVKAGAAIEVHKMLLDRLNSKVPEKNGDLPTPP